MSFYYLTQKGAFLRERMAADPAKRFMVDSGAHTFFKGGDHDNWRAAEWEMYLARYAKWLREHRHYVYSAVELDIGKLVGQPIVETWRERYFRPLEMLGMQVVYVWHYSMGFGEFERMCRCYRYVGLTNDTYKAGDTHRMMQTARRYRTKVHGFAITGYRAIRDYGMATADSTTWLKKGSQYGEWYLWTGDKLKLVAHKEDRPLWRKHVESIGMDYAAACREDYRVNASINIHEFRRMEEAYARRNVRDYWRMRLPYPAVIDAMTTRQLEEWRDWFDIVDTVNKHGLRKTLRIISAVQNSDLAAYRTDAQADTIMGDALGLLVEIGDERTLDKYRDMWNNQFATAERPLARTKEDFGDKEEILERDAVDVMESLTEYESEEKHDQSGDEENEENEEGEAVERPGLAEGAGVVGALDERGGGGEPVG